MRILNTWTTLYQVAMEQKTGKHRNTTDKFYTKQSVAESCVREFFDVISTCDTDLIVEPSAGAGAFSEVLRLYHGNVLAFDLVPEHPSIIQQDFLLTTFDLQHKGRIHFVGNPPFGRQSSLAKKFIKRCGKVGYSISFVLPKSFRKESMQKAFPLCFHLIHEIDLPHNSFLVNNKDHHVPCVFQIWVRKPGMDREIHTILTTSFRFVAKTECPHVAFRRVGGGAGNMTKDFQNKCEQTHYFLKFDSATDLEWLLKTYTPTVASDNTVGPKSISKKELVVILCKVLNTQPEKNET